MKARLHNLYKRLFEARGYILMYHRIAELKLDIWDIAVSPANFEAQLQWLQKNKTVLPLPELITRLLKNNLRRNSIAITFDDGYLDNFLIAKPILEKYEIPATFFIASGNTGQQTEFWWDELEYLILETPILPANFAIKIGNDLIKTNLENETILNRELTKKHQIWNAGTEQPPTKRSQLFYDLWKMLKPIPFSEQKEALQKIRSWIGTEEIIRQDFTSMSENQIKELSQHPLFTIGAHTVTHPALAFHPEHFQKAEIRQNIKKLNEITGNKIDLLAYPYGNYNTKTIEVVKDFGLLAAFTTEEQLVTKNSQLNKIGRFQVANYKQSTFAERMKYWSR